MARKLRELAPFFSRATTTAPLFFNLAPPRRAPPFLVRASGAVAVKVAQVPSTAEYYNKKKLENSITGYGQVLLL